MKNEKGTGVVLLICMLGFGVAQAHAQNCTPGTIPVWVQQGTGVHLGCSTVGVSSKVYNPTPGPQAPNASGVFPAAGPNMTLVVGLPSQGTQPFQIEQSGLSVKSLSKALQKLDAQTTALQKALDKANATIQTLQKQASAQQSTQGQLNAANQATILGLRAEMKGLQSALKTLAEDQSSTKGEGLTGPKGYASGYLALWSGASTKLVNSVVQQDKSGDLAAGTTPGEAAKLQVVGGGAAALLGVNNGSGRGVEGDSTSAGGVVGKSDNANGVTGVTKSQTAGAIVGIGKRAALFQGNVGVTGTFAVQGFKMFKIDDPLEPAGKYLSHVSVESSEATNFYNGEAILNRAGEAVVRLPDWFEALNKNFRYQLTAVGAPAPGLYIANKISHNSFKIAGGESGQEISWQITGVRHDAWAEAHPLKVEEEKLPEEQGTYLSPELFGQPEEKGLAWIELPEFRNELLALRENKDTQPLLAKVPGKTTAHRPMSIASKIIADSEDQAGVRLGGSLPAIEAQASQPPLSLK